MYLALCVLFVARGSHNPTTNATVANNVVSGLVPPPVPTLPVEVVTQASQALLPIVPAKQENNVTLAKLGSEGKAVFDKELLSLAQYPELFKLGSNIPTRCLSSRAASTTNQYARSFADFRSWLSRFAGIHALPTQPLIVACYLESRIQNGVTPSVLQLSCYSIAWANGLYGFENPCHCPLVKNTLEAGLRLCSRPKRKKEPITPGMIQEILVKFACEDANLSNVRVACFCVVAYAAFLRFNELHNLRCCDVEFAPKHEYIKLQICGSKTDVYRDGACILISKTAWQFFLPCKIISRYISLGDIDLKCELPFFRNLIYHKSTNSYSLGRRGLSYSRALEIFLNTLEGLGYSKSDYGLHSLRAGGASSAANAGTGDRLFKRSETAKDDYVKPAIIWTLYFLFQNLWVYNVIIIYY
jgi:hypothetical protein